MIQAAGKLSIDVLSCGGLWSNQTCSSKVPHHLIISFGHLELRSYTDHPIQPTDKAIKDLDPISGDCSD